MAKLEELEKRLQILEDIEAIKKLKWRYAQICDNGDVEDRSMLFTEDCVLLSRQGDRGGERPKGVTTITKGRDALRKRVAQTPKSITWKEHFFVQPDIEINGNKAKGLWRVWSVANQDGKAVFGASLLDEEYEKINGEWLISKYDLTVFVRAPYGKTWEQPYGMIP